MLNVVAPFLQSVFVLPPGNGQALTVFSSKTLFGDKSGSGLRELRHLLRHFVVPVSGFGCEARAKQNNDHGRPFGGIWIRRSARTMVIISAGFGRGFLPRDRMISNQTGYLSDGSEIIRPGYDER